MPYMTSSGRADLLRTGIFSLVSDWEEEEDVTAPVRFAAVRPQQPISQPRDPSLLTPVGLTKQ